MLSIMTAAAYASTVMPRTVCVPYQQCLIGKIATDFNQCQLCSTAQPCVGIARAKMICIFIGILHVIFVNNG